MTVQHVLTILAVRDLARSRALYCAILDGWRVVVEVPPYVELESPSGMRLGLYVRAGFGQNVGTVPVLIGESELAPSEIYLSVDDPRAYVARALAHGATLLSDVAPRAWGDEAGYVRDPDGHVVALARIAPRG